MNKQSRSATAYLFRNFNRLVLYVLPFAIIGCIFLQPLGEMSFVANYFEGNISTSNFVDNFASSFTLVRFGNNVIILALALLLFCLGQCFLVVKIEHHMKTGELLHFPLRKAVRLFVSILVYVICVYLAINLTSFIGVGFAYAINKFNVLALTFYSAIAIDFAVKVIAVFFFLSLLLAYPIRYSESYTFASALSYSARITAGNCGKLWLYAICYVLCRAMVIAVAYFTKSFYLNYLVFLVYYVWISIILPTTAYVGFYSKIGGTRRDLSATFDVGGGYYE